MQQGRPNQIVTLLLAVAIFAGAFVLGLAGLMAANALINDDSESAVSGISTPSPTVESESDDPTPTYQSSCSMFSSCYNIPPQPTITPPPPANPVSIEATDTKTCPAPAGLTAHETC